MIKTGAHAAEKCSAISISWKNWLVLTPPCISIAKNLTSVKWFVWNWKSVLSANNYQHEWTVWDRMNVDRRWKNQFFRMNLLEVCLRSEQIVMATYMCKSWPSSLTFNWNLHVNYVVSLIFGNWFRRLETNKKTKKIPHQESILKN